MEKNKKQISKIQKTQKQNKRGKKGEKKESQKGKKMREKLTCPFAFILFSRFAFILHLFCFLPGKMQKCQQKKANRKSKINAKKCKWTSPFVPMFFPFWRSFLFPIYFASAFFFGFEVLLFDFPCGFLSYSGEHKTRQDHSIITLLYVCICIYIYIHRLMYFYTENLMSPFNPALKSCN